MYEHLRVCIIKNIFPNKYRYLYALECEHKIKGTMQQHKVDKQNKHKCMPNKYDKKRLGKQDF